LGRAPLAALAPGAPGWSPAPPSSSTPSADATQRQTLHQAAVPASSAGTPPVAEPASPATPPTPPQPAPFVSPRPLGLPRQAKEAVLGGQRGCVVWFTGLSGAGKSAAAAGVEAALAGRGVAAALLDGDALRTGLCAGLGFSPEDRAENVRRAGEAALLAADAGLVALAALVSPYAAGRAGVRARCGAARGGGVPFVEVHVAAPVAVCAARDAKGLYAAAKEGRLRGLTGVCPSAPYEPPEAPELRLAGEGDVGEAARAVVAYLESAGLIPPLVKGDGSGDCGGVANNAVPRPGGRA
jgi:adenylyl-sulfate kinase